MNRKMKFQSRQLMFCLLFLFSCLSVIGAQEIGITGVVTDKDGPMPGVNVMIKGSQQGTATDANGSYSLQVSGSNAILVFTYVGYVSQEFVVGNRRTINVTLSEKTSDLDEVVVIGYGNAKKTDLTGSIAQVKADDLRKFMPTNVNDLLRTSIAGMSVGYGIQAKGNSSMLIRGETTLRAGVEPLIVLDLQTQKMGAVLDERARELYFEEARKIELTRMAITYARTGIQCYNGKTYRYENFHENNFWFDRVDEISDFYNKGVRTPFSPFTCSPYHVFWPIPATVINANTGGVINQNKG